MDLIQTMRVFTRVAQLRGFSAAARDLNLSTAAVTKHVAALETRGGVRLLERTTRRVQLTESGRMYLERCLECLQAVGDADAALSEMVREPAGMLRVTTPVDLGPHILPIVTAYQRAHPRVTVDLRMSNRSLDLVDQGLDLGIDVLRPVHASCVVRPLVTSRLAIWAAPAYLRAHGRPRTPADLQRHRHLVFSEPRPRTELQLRKGRLVRTVTLAPVLLSDSGDALRRALVEGAGLHMAPSFVVADDVASGRLEPVLPDWSLEPLTLCAIYPSRRFLSATVRTFLEALHARFGHDPGRDPWWPRGAA
jgi:DNA-binding transcriptional LysR family regulator